MGDFTIDPFGGYTYSDPTAVGPQPDGTNLVAADSTVPIPADAGGGTAMQYPTAVTDILTKGLSGLTDLYKFNQLLDYKKYEATRTGVYQQGQLAANTAVAQRQSSNLTLILMVGILVFALKG